MYLWMGCTHSTNHPNLKCLPPVQHSPQDIAHAYYHCPLDYNSMPLVPFGYTVWFCQTYSPLHMGRTFLGQLVHQYLPWTILFTPFLSMLLRTFAFLTLSPSNITISWNQLSLQQIPLLKPLITSCTFPKASQSQKVNNTWAYCQAPWHFKPPPIFTLPTVTTTMPSPRVEFHDTMQLCTYDPQADTPPAHTITSNWLLNPLLCKKQLQHLHLSYQ